MQINRMKVRNYRSFEDIEIHFGPHLTVLVGRNGAGKTALLDALALFLVSYARLFWPREKYLCKKQDFRKNGENPRLSYLVNISSDDSLQEIRCELKENVKQEVVTKFSGESLQYLKNNYGKQAFPVVVYYGARRALDVSDYAIRSDEYVPVLEDAYKNVAEGQIDIWTTVQWFISRVNYEAREAVARRDLNFAFPSLAAVRRAVGQVLEDFHEPSVTGVNARICVTRKTEDPRERENRLTLAQLGNGTRNTLALVLDLARRMATANEHVCWEQGESVLSSPGIVLIDEVELSMHPSWQQTILPTLVRTFPRVQFIVTTHSPQVLTSIEPGHIRILSDGRACTPGTTTYGASSARVLQEVLGVSPRPADAEPCKALARYFEYLNSPDYACPQARELRAKLNVWLKGDPVLDDADLLLKDQEMLEAEQLGKPEQAGT